MNRLVDHFRNLIKFKMSHTFEPAGVTSCDAMWRVCHLTKWTTCKEVDGDSFEFEKLKFNLIYLVLTFTVIGIVPNKY